MAFARAFSIAMFKFIGATGQFLGNTPRASVGLHKFANKAALAVRFDRAFGENIVPNSKEPLVWATSINVLAVICAVVMDKFPCDGTSAAEHGCLLRGKRCHPRRV